MPRDRFTNEISVRTGEMSDGSIFQEIEDIHGHITRKVADMAALQLDEAVRAKLIGLGWTPPIEFNGKPLPPLEVQSYQDRVTIAKDILAMEYHDDPVMAQKIRRGESSNGEIPRAIRAITRVLSWGKR